METTPETIDLTDVFIGGDEFSRRLQSFSKAVELFNSRNQVEKQIFLKLGSLVPLSLPYKESNYVLVPTFTVAKFMECAPYIETLLSRVQPAQFMSYMNATANGQMSFNEMVKVVVQYWRAQVAQEMIALSCHCCNITGDDYDAFLTTIAPVDILAIFDKVIEHMNMPEVYALVKKTVEKVYALQSARN